MGVLHDPLLVHFLPEQDIHEHHETHVSAPAVSTFTAARKMDLSRFLLVRASSPGMSYVLGASPDETTRPRRLLAQTLALGWRILAEELKRKVVVGTVTQPQEGNVVLQGLSSEVLTFFDTPTYVRIACALKVEPRGCLASVFHTQTHLSAPGAYARSRFRRYWAVFSPSILLIYLECLSLVKADAERCARKVLQGVQTVGKPEPA